MAGKATLTTVLSIKAMLEARMVAASIQVLASGLHGFPGGAARIAASSHGDFTRYGCPVRLLRFLNIAGNVCSGACSPTGENTFPRRKRTGPATRGLRRRRIPAYSSGMNGWCREGESNPHAPLGASDFKSLHSRRTEMHDDALTRTSNGLGQGHTAPS